MKQRGFFYRHVNYFCVKDAEQRVQKGWLHVRFKDATYKERL